MHKDTNAQKGKKDADYTSGSSKRDYKYTNLCARGLNQRGSNEWSIQIYAID